MVGFVIANNTPCFFPSDSISLCNLLLAVKTKVTSSKCLFNESVFLNTVALPTPLIEEVV